MQRKVLTAAVLAGVAGVFPTDAATLTIQPAWQGPAGSPPQALEAKLMAAQGGGWATAASGTFEHLAPLTLTAPPGTWWLVLTGPDAWAESKEIRLPEEGSTLSVKVWPGGTLEGRLRRDPAESGPLDLKTRFTPAPGSKGPAAALDRCRVESDLKFKCRVPALDLDLRLRAEPYITHYRWGLKVPRGGTVQLGELKLERGASLVGWVATEDGSKLAPGARVQLEPAGLATPIASDVTPRASLLQREAQVNDRGFFHFDGIAPGEYLVTATQAPFGPASSQASVLAGTEAELLEPLLLAKPETLEISVQPPQTPWGDPWRALLFRSDRRSQRGERVRAETLPLAGFLKLDGLPKGSYVVQILAHEGQAWAIRGLELGKEPMPITIEVEAVQVQGEVHLGKKPVAAKVVFGGRFGGTQVMAVADEEGHFSTMLPRAGEWDVDIDAASPRIYTALRKVPVEPKPNEASAFVQLNLPDTHLRVEVADEAGRPSRALINVDPGEAAMRARMAQESTDWAGRAELYGLPEGSYFVQALGGGGVESENTAFELHEGSASAPLRLTLRQLREIQVRVLGRGQPLPGATAFIFPVLSVPASVSPMRADANGELSVRLPKAAAMMDAFVEAPGFAFRITRLATPTEGRVALELRSDMGTLHLHAPVPDGSTKPHALLLHAGAELDWLLIPQLSREAKATGTLSNELTVPNAEPGPWALCPAKADGRADATSPQCVSGVLTPNGTLELRLRE